MGQHIDGLARFLGSGDLLDQRQAVPADLAVDGDVFLGDLAGAGIRRLRARGRRQRPQGAHHLVVGNVTELLHVSEDSQHGPRAEFDDGRDSARQNAWQILSDTAARNVRHRRHAFCGDELLRYPPIAAVGLHELVADFAFDFVDVGFGLVLGDFE